MLGVSLADAAAAAAYDKVHYKSCCNLCFCAHLTTSNLESLLLLFNEIGNDAAFVVGVDSIRRLATTYLWPKGTEPGWAAVGGWGEKTLGFPHPPPSGSRMKSPW